MLCGRLVKQVLQGLQCQLDDLSTRSLISSYSGDVALADLRTKVTNVEYFSFSADGSHMIHSGTYADTIQTLSLSTPYDITTGTLTGSTLSSKTNPLHPQFVDDGNKFCVTEFNNNFRCYGLTTPYQMLTSPTQSGSTLTQSTLGQSTGTAQPFWMSNDGNHIFAITDDATLGQCLVHADLSTSYDPSSVTNIEKFSIESNFGFTTISSFSGVWANETGTLVYFGTGNAYVRVLRLGTAWDVSTTTHDGSWALVYTPLDHTHFAVADTQIYTISRSTVAADNEANLYGCVLSGVPSPTHFFPMGSDTTDRGSVGGWSFSSVSGSPTVGATWRKDGTGSSTRGSYYYSTAGGWPITFGPTGVSIAVVLRPTTIVNRFADGQNSGGISHMNSANDSLWCLAFDDWELDNDVVVPNFTLTIPTIYNRVADFTTAKVYASARSSAGIVVNNVYHLCGTFDRSTGEAKLYVNGTLVDTDTISSEARLTTFIEWTGATNFDLENGSRLDRNQVTVGQRYADGSWVSNGLADCQDIKIWEGTVLDADQVAAEAALYNL